MTHSHARHRDQAHGNMSQHPGGLSGLGWSQPDLLCVVLAAALILIFCAYLWTDLTYDEAVYLRLARTIAESGLPLRRSYAAFSKFQLFENSPPLVLYLASLSQLLFPGDEVPARLVNFIVFVLPTYGVVWWVARTRFGPWAAVASLTVLLTNVSYVRATSHVLLNIPLGLLACLGLVAFHEASSSVAHRRTNSLIAGMAMLLAVWTKYQAVCIVGGNRAVRWLCTREARLWRPQADAPAADGSCGQRSGRRDGTVLVLLGLRGPRDDRRDFRMECPARESLFHVGGRHRPSTRRDGARDRE